MSVNVSTITSVCLYCKRKSETDDGKDFHEIYNEVGLELGLPTLVETLFRIELKNDNQKYLCNDCVIHLIELYDLEEHTKEQLSKADDFEIPKNNEQDFVKIEAIDDCVGHSVKDKCLRSGDWKLNDTAAAGQNNTSNRNVKKNNSELLQKSVTICKNLTRDDGENDHQKSGTGKTENIDEIKSNPFKQDHVPGDNDIAQSLEEIFVIRNGNLLQNFGASATISPMEVTCSSEQDCSENIEFIVDDEVQNFDIEVMFDENVTNTTEELEFSESQLNAEDEQICEAELDPRDSQRCEQSNFLEDNIYEEEMEEALVVNSQNENNQEIYLEEIFFEEIDDINCNEVSAINEEKECDVQMNSDVPNMNVQEEEPVAISLNSRESEKQFISTDVNGTDKIIDNDGDEFADNNFFLEEEYLIEETKCSQEYDNVDLNEYLDKALVTNFQDLLLNWETECKLCHDHYNTFEKLLKHSCITDLDEKQQLCCVIRNCEEDVNNLAILARHLILKHCDKLESIPIYGKCPDCQKTFSNIIDFNKHSCCRNIKRKTGSPNYCQYCDMDFQSLKRYVFHMQFHLTNRRPKMCLLCGELFNNSNDFFEHTQYQHISDTALACTKCDRFFKEKDVFDSHIDLHEDSKYLFECKLCPKKYTNKFGLCQHMDIYHNNKSGTLQCEHCEKQFVSKSSYRNHVKSHTSDVLTESFICSSCGIITNKLESIKYHIESDEQSPCFSSPIEEKTLGLGYTCENCSIDFLTIKQLKQHRLSKSHSDDLFHCVICRHAFKSLRHMRNHCINHKNFKEWQASFPITRFFVCNIGDCQEFYPIWTTLYYHKKRPHKSPDISSSTKEFKCQFCQQLCTSKMSLAVHVARSHNNSNVKCPHCKRSIKSQKLLEEHIHRYHTPVKCDICFKKFKHRRNLESHNNMIHLNLKRYFCKYCEKGYFHKSERDIHEKKVHPETPYKCKICNFVTNYPESLEIHMDMHNNQLKFKCEFCGKAFGRKQPFECHLKRHANKKEYICAKLLNESGCNAAFLTHNSLKKHILSKHQDSNYCINMQKEKERKQRSSTTLEILEIENISFEILESDDDSKSEKSSKTSIVMRLNDVDFDQDADEMVLESDVEYDEP